MVSKKTLLDIQRRAKNVEISEEEMYTSAAYHDYMRDLASSVLPESMEPTMLLLHDPDDSTTGYTNGNRICINTANSIATHYASIEGRFLANLGILFHECAHCRYLDFNGEKKAFKELQKGEFWPSIPEADGKEELKNREELLDAISKPGAAAVISNMAAELSNIIADAHDEACMCTDFGELINNAINASAFALQSEAKPLEEIKDADGLSVMYTLLLEYIRFYDIIVLDDKTRNNEYAKKTEELAPILNQARFTNSTEEKMALINRIILKLWPYVKDLCDKAKEKHGSGNGNGDPGDDSGDQGSGLSQSQLQKIAEALAQAKKNAGLGSSSPAPEKKATAKNIQAPTPNAKQPQKPNEQAAQSAMQSVVSSVAAAKAESQIEEEMSRQLSGMLENVGTTPLHETARFSVKRDLQYSEQDVLAYEQEYAAVKDYSKSLQRHMLNVLRDLNDEALVRKNYGPIMKPKDSYRKDQKFFFKKKMPADLPNMSVGILVDQSGSMGGERLNTCRRAAILLEDFAAGLGIPVMVAGHNVVHGECRLNVYVPFDTAGRKDRYRLMHMYAGGCNRDGLMLGKMAGLMEARAEDVRLLFIISDGQPSDGPIGTKAYDELREICKKAEKKGIQVYAAGIGYDRDVLQDIYGNRFLDIENLADLPRILTKMVRKRIA